MTDFAERIASLEATVASQAEQIAGLVEMIERRDGNIRASAAALRVLLRLPEPREKLRFAIEREMDEFVGRFMGAPTTSEAMLEGFYWTSKLLLGAVQDRQDD